MIDFHCHLDLFPSPAAAAAEIDHAGTYVLSVTNTPKAFPNTAQFAKGRRRIRTALGLHPQLVHERHGEVGMFVRLLGETGYVGEIGIDGGEDSVRHLDTQKDVFRRLLRACADAGGRVMSIHSRHASGEVIEAIQRQPDAGLPVFHWFSGPVAHAQKAADMGAWFSVGLPMLRSRRAFGNDRNTAARSCPDRNRRSVRFDFGRKLPDKGIVLVGGRTGKAVGSG